MEGAACENMNCRPRARDLQRWIAKDGARSFRERLMKKFEDGNEFDWEDLRQLVRRTLEIDRRRITTDCVRGFAFLRDLTEDERVLAADPYQREHDVATELGLTRAQPS